MRAAPANKWDELERKIGQMDEDDMQQTVTRDPWTIAAVVAGTLVNIVVASVWFGRLDTRVTNAESEIKALQAKGEVDAAQNTQIAVLSTQLGQIQSTVSEIKATVSREKTK